MKSLIQSRNDNIQVLVRVKPEAGDFEIDECNSCITVANRMFQFDQVIPPRSTQQDVFTLIGQPLIRNAVEGFNGCVFAYGQTGSGKTHTLVGNNDGILPQSLQYLFATIDSNSIIQASYLEIYNEHIYDLLDDCEPLQLREDTKKGTYVQNLTEIVISNYEEALTLLKKGHSNRHVAATKMNSESSRSHAVFYLQYSTSKKQEQCELHLSSKLNFVDLAGSERQKTSQTEGQRLKEASAINKSLSALGTVISAIVEQYKGKSIHIPYRDSKLTNLLKDCLGGNSKTYMVAAITPQHIAETLSTLKFADRVKQIKTKPQINKEYTGEEFNRMQSMIMQLRMELQEKTQLLSQIQPSDALQSQLQLQFEEVKQILLKINQGSFKFDEIEQNVQDFTEKKSVILQILKSLDINISDDRPTNIDLEAEHKLRTEILQQEDAIYKLQKRKKELEQRIMDQQECSTAILTQQQRYFDEQMKIKEDIVQQLKEDIDNGEIGRLNLQKDLDQQKHLFQQQKDTISALHQKQLQYINEEQVKGGERVQEIQAQQKIIEEQKEINEQLRKQFEHVHQIISENTLKYQEEINALQEYIRKQDNILIQYKRMNQDLEEQMQQLPSQIDNYKLQYEQIKTQYLMAQEQLERANSEVQNNQILREEIERMEHQLQVIEVHEDSLIEEVNLYRNTLNQIEKSNQMYEQIFNKLSIQLEMPSINLNIIKYQDNQFNIRLDQILKSKQKAKKEIQQIKSDQNYINRQLQMKDKCIQELQVELVQLQKNQQNTNLQNQLNGNERQQREQNYEKKISELKFECERLRSDRISLKADQTKYERQCREVEDFMEKIIKKLNDYIATAFRKNRVMTQQQQLLYLKTTELNQNRNIIIESLIEIIILDSVDKQYINYSQLRLN